MKIKYIITKQQFDALYNQSALTWEGMSADKANLEAIQNWLCENGAIIAGVEPTFHIIVGKRMNTYYGLRGANAYPNDLTIVSVTDINQIKIALARFGVGGRWFDDIIDNNARREV